MFSLTGQYRRNIFIGLEIQTGAINTEQGFAIMRSGSIYSKPNFSVIAHPYSTRFMNDITGVIQTILIFGGIFSP